MTLSPDPAEIRDVAAGMFERVWRSERLEELDDTLADGGGERVRGCGVDEEAVAAWGPVIGVVRREGASSSSSSSSVGSEGTESSLTRRGGCWW